MNMREFHETIQHIWRVNPELRPEFSEARLKEEMRRAWAACPEPPQFLTIRMRRGVQFRGIDLARPSCDCPGCEPRQHPRIEPRAEQAAFANAIGVSGLNTPDRKQLGAAQYMRRAP